MAFAENFVENMRAAMKARGWTQKQLAIEAGLHWQTIHRILAGNMTPTLDVCEKITNALELSPGKIFHPQAK